MTVVNLKSGRYKSCVKIKDMEGSFVEGLRKYKIFQNSAFKNVCGVLAIDDELNGRNLP